MKRIKVPTTLFFLVLLSLVFQTSLKADEFDKKTIFTFDAPAEIPGKVLPAGTYVFKRMGSPVTGNQHIVQIFNQDETQLLAPLRAVPDYHSNPTDKARVEFGEEATSGSAQPVMEWFYPGDSYGHEF